MHPIINAKHLCSISQYLFFFLPLVSPSFRFRPSTELLPGVRLLHMARYDQCFPPVKSLVR